MNNSKLIMEGSVLEEPRFDRGPMLQEKRAELAKIVEAVNNIASSEDWRVLKALVFDGLVESLERKIRTESAKEELNAPEIYRLQGTLNLAKKYADFVSMGNVYKLELKNINKELNAKEETEHGSSNGS